MVKSSKKALGNALKHRLLKAKSNFSKNTAEGYNVPDKAKCHHSLIEESSLMSIIRNAELAGRKFETEKMPLIVNPSKLYVLPTVEKQRNTETLRIEYENGLQIPRRPNWNPQTTPEELRTLEYESFLEWRRKLAQLENLEGICMTPYEKNLEFWRQLWRVLERSDVVIQILDARNPLLFRCKDLEDYVMHLGEDKKNILMLNKADLLKLEYREYWCQYFDSLDTTILFYSAVSQTAEDQCVKDAEKRANEENVSSNPTLHEDIGHSCNDAVTADSPENVDSSNIQKITEAEAETNNTQCECVIGMEGNPSQTKLRNSSKILSPDDLVQWLKDFCSCFSHKSKVVVGMVGYPNVGKSSTINSLLHRKKVPVSKTPGKTKHFQTLNLCDGLMLCDCPGLVFPSFTFSKAELLLNGILPVDQMREYVEPVAIMCQRISRKVFEKKFGLKITRWSKGDDYSNAYELLDAYATARGFMSHKNVPNRAEAARALIKNYVNGNLIHCNVPAGYVEINENDDSDEISETVKIKEKEFKKEFEKSIGDSVKKKQLRMQRNEQLVLASEATAASLPKKHFKKNKHIKLRNKFASNDVHVGS